MKTKSSVLIIDDEPIVCESCQRILAKEGYDVETNTNPVEGYTRAIENNYDVILLDLSMQQLSGLELLSKLREKKPDQAVIIITGYPTKESKKQSKDLHVSNYILKPFEPKEIIDPVKAILQNSIKPAVDKIDDDKRSFKLPEWKMIDDEYFYYNSGWLQKGNHGHVKVGGQLPVHTNRTVKSIKTLSVNDFVYRGLPIAEILLDNDEKYVIPSVVTGRIVEINKYFIDNPFFFENYKNDENWIARIIPENLNEDLSAAHRRRLIYLGKDNPDENLYIGLIKKYGYEVNALQNVDDALKVIAKQRLETVIIDAKSLSEYGPAYVETINSEFPHVRIIVFDTSDSKFEILYRQKKIFYYEVQPILQSELHSVLYNAFCYSKVKQTIECKTSAYLPPFINRIRILNRHKQRVTILIYDKICEKNKGLGCKLYDNLLKHSFPVEINLTYDKYSLNDPNNELFLQKEKESCDKLILLYKENLNCLPGNIRKEYEVFSNRYSNRNTLVMIALQASIDNKSEEDFDKITTIELAELIENEMTQNVKIKTIELSSN